MKKILFVTSKSLGGSGKYISSLAGALKERGWWCELIYFPSGVPQDQELEASFSKSYHFTRAPGFKPANVISNIAQIRKLVKSGKYDWVHTHTSIGGFVGKLGAWLSGCKVKIGATLHAFGADEFTPVPQKWFYWIIERCLDLITDAYVAPSRYMLTYGERTHVLTPRKVTVIHNSLPLAAPSVNAVEVGCLKRRELSISDEELVFLFCGRLEEQKGVDVLIAGFAKFLEKGKAKLVICGIGADEESLRKQAEGLGISGSIVWAGWKADVAPFYAMADAYVMTSRWESFGLVFLEAMNYALPVISTRTQAIPEVVADGETGLLGRNGSASDLANNMIKLALDAKLRKRMGSAGRARLAENFSFDGFVQAHTQWYEQVG